MPWGSAPKPKPQPVVRPNVDMVGAVYREYFRSQAGLGPGHKLKCEALASWQKASDFNRQQLERKLKEFGLDAVIDFE